MIVEDQTAVIEFLSSGEAYARRAEPVERIDTHISVVFLVADRAYKLKRAVRFDYVDFSTRERRQAACEAELRVNRRTAPALYLRVVAVTRAPSGLALGGSGEPVDFLVEMVRFDQAMLFDRLAERHVLDASLVRQVAGAIARFHQETEPRRDHGGVAGMAWVIDGNAAGFQEEAGVLDQSACARLDARARQALDRAAPILEARRLGGLVRRCHGDLHLRNLCLVNGVATLFDAVEFNDEIACIDVLYDFAFLLMDLEHRRLRDLANIAFNEYLRLTRDYDGLRLLPLFLACRAAIRTKTSAAAARVQQDPLRTAALRAEATGYLQMALDYLEPPPARLIAIGGLSGSGKSTVAARIAPGIGAAPGALVLRSDLERKALMGVPPTTPLSEDAYSPIVDENVYEALRAHAATGLAAGHSVIVDAVFARREERDAMAAVARPAGVPFTALWLDAPPDALLARVRSRQDDASDADAGVVRRQLAAEIGPLDWRRVDAAGEPERVVGHVEAALQGS